MSGLRRFAAPLAIIAAIVLFWMENPWFRPEDYGLRPIATYVFWALAVIVLFLIFQDRNEPSAETVEVEGPKFTQYLFANTRAGLFWLPVRIFIGFEWIAAGLHKFEDPKWMETGESLLGYWQRAVAIPEQGRPPITFEWYRDFLNLLINAEAHTWFAKLITLGELAVGIGLLIGCLVGVAAFFGATMNMSFLLAGSASSNPVLFFFEVGLMLAWRVAGYYGLDRVLLPKLGTPWKAKVAIGGN